MNRRQALRWIAGAILSLWIGRELQDDEGWAHIDAGGSPIAEFDEAMQKILTMAGTTPNWVMISESCYISLGGDPDAIVREE